MPGGRPPKWESVEELKPLIDKYFTSCDKEERPYTIVGLAYDLDITRDTLINYGKKDEFFDTIKKAKEKCLRQQEERLCSGQSNVAGLIFSMKNNYGYKDKIEQDVTVRNNDITDEELDAKIQALAEKMQGEE